MPELNYAEALRMALDEELARDERVFLMGEDIGNWGQGGGIFGVTRGLLPKYGAQRVRDTEAHPQVSMRHHIKGIPSLILFRNGAEVARTSGAMRVLTTGAPLGSAGSRGAARRGRRGSFQPPFAPSGHAWRWRRWRCGAG